MKSIFRATTPADADAISKLLATAFETSSVSSPFNREAMHWKYWSPHPFWEGSRSYVLESQGRVLAHGAVVPQRGCWKNHRFRSVHLVDWGALPDVPAAGASVLKGLLQLADASCIVGGSDQSQRVLPALGFKEVGIATRYVRPLHPLRRLRAMEGKTAKALLQFSRSLVWAVQAPSASPKKGMATPWSARSGGEAWPVVTDDSSTAFFERTPELFAYLQSCPIAQTRLFRYERDSSACGYFFLAAVPGQVRIADCWLQSNNASEWRDLYLSAVVQANSWNEAAEIVTVVSDDLRRGALQQAGFHPRGSYPIRFLPKKPELREISAVRCEMLDGDAAYNHSGKAQFWA